MTMTEFYTRYNLNKYNFAEISGVGTRSLIKFAEGASIREDTKKRIETAMRVAEKYDLVRPQFDHTRRYDHWYNTKHFGEVLKYNERFRELIKKESLG